MCGEESGSSRGECPLRICLIGSATSVHVQRWATWLTDHGYDVHVLSNFPGGISHVHVWPLPSRQKYGGRAYLLSLSVVWRTIRAIRPAIVHIHHLGGSMLYVPLLPMRLPLVLSAWGSDVLRPSYGHRLVLRTFLPRASLVLTTSRQMADVLRRSYGVDVGRIRTESGGISAEAAKLQDEARRSSVRNRMGIADDAFLVFCNRSMGAVYGTSTVLEGFQRFHGMFGKSWLVLIEGPEPKNAQVLAYRRELCKKAEATECVSVVPGEIDQEAMLGLLRASDAIVSVPTTDQRSASVLEALSQCPTVICSDIPPMRELQDEGFRLAFVRPECPVDLAAALQIASGETQSATAERLRLNRVLIVNRESFDAHMHAIASEYARLVRGAS